MFKNLKNFLAFRRRPITQDLVNFIMIFKREADKLDILDFLQEYIDGGFLKLRDISEGAAVNERTKAHEADVWIAHLTSTKKNFEHFQKEFGHLTTIRKENEE